MLFLQKYQCFGGKYFVFTPPFRITALFGIYHYCAVEDLFL